jgi:hypothetical protein
MRKKMKTISSICGKSLRGAARVTLASILLANCGGRVSHPVEAFTSYDDRLSCDQLRAERKVNDARIADLNDERRNSQNNNVGLVAAAPLTVALPMFVDVSNAEAKEITAFEARNQNLDALIAKKCEATSAAADG